MPGSRSGRGDGNLPLEEEERSHPAMPSHEERSHRVKILKLYRAVLNGDWKEADQILSDITEGIQVKISNHRDTALHIAAAAKRTYFVKELVKKMSKNDLEETNDHGNTALFLAAMSGTVQIAEEMIKKHEKIANVKDKAGTLPIQIAAALGHRDMVEYLYKKTKKDLSRELREELFVGLIEKDFYDIALQLLKDYPNLDIVHARGPIRENKDKGATADEGATADDKNKGATEDEGDTADDNNKRATALHVLARKHPTFSNRDNLKRFCNLGAKDVEKKKRQALELVKLIWERVILLGHSEISELIGKPSKLIFDAAERGNVELLSILIREYTDLIYKFDNEENNYSIFHYAVKYRQENVFDLIYEIDLNKEIFLGTKDKDGNNILHLAGMLAPPDRLNISRGPVIKMQQELMWFQKVEEVVAPSYVEAING